MYKTGFVALVGLPNAGKSTLLNALVGEKVAIVSPKPQTTRKRVLGILNSFESTPKAQLVFVDSPGILDVASSDLNKFLQKEYNAVIADSDFVIAVLNADEATFSKHERVLDIVRKSGKPSLIILTKIDLVTPQEAQELEEVLKAHEMPVLTFSVNAPINLTRPKLVELVSPHLAETHHPLYDADLYTTQNLKDLAAEIIREKCFLRLHQEIPFGLAIKIQSFQEQADITRIEADIVIEKESHKKITIGQGGSTLKAIGTDARKELEQVIGSKVFLKLFVATKPRWMTDQNLMKELGYVIRD